jgi:hypothetical protein
MSNDDSVHYAGQPTSGCHSAIGILVIRQRLTGPLGVRATYVARKTAAGVDSPKT